MKLLLIVISFFYLSCSSGTPGETKTATNSLTSTHVSDTFRLSCDKPHIKSSIFRSDTDFNYKKYKGHYIRSFDKDGRLIQLFVSNLFESNSKNIFSSTTIYDIAGHIVYEDQTKGFIRWHCYCYRYDAKGHLTFKEGYSSGEIGLRVKYIYDKDKLVKEITQRSGQITEKAF